MENEITNSAGSVRHADLPDGMIGRITAFKEALGDADTVSIEQTINTFKQDRDPEKELAIWENIARTFVAYFAHNPTNDLQIRKEVLAVIVGASMGTRDWSFIKGLSEDQIKHIALNYTGVL